MNDQNSSIGMLKSALIPRGFTFDDLTVGSPAKDFTVITSPAGNKLIVGSENPVFPFNTCSARLIANDKIKAYDYAKLRGVAIPKTILQTDEKVTQESLQLLGDCKSVIVKPRKGSGSKGLTLDVTEPAELQVAVANALQHHKEVIIQEQFFGEEIRFVVINGKAEAALLREKPKVIGDGVSTVSQLIEEEELRRKAIDHTQIHYPALHDVIEDKSCFTNESVPTKGQVFELGKGTMIRTGASMYNVLAETHADYIAAVENLAEQLGKGFIVIDIMVKDYRQHATEGSYVFIEFNLAPALALFYSCRDGNQFAVIEDFLIDMIEDLMDGSKSGR